MFKFRTLNIVFILLLITEALLVYFLNIPVYIFVPMIAGYLTITAYGSAMICSGLYTEAYCSSATNKKEIALSFDDGPNETITPQVLKLLEKYNIEAAFFVIGSKAESQPELIKKISDKAHIIGNHSYSHSNMMGIFSRKRVMNEISKCDETISYTITKKPKFYRPPFGVTNPQIAKAIKKTGKVCIGWNVRSMDTTKRTNEQICNRVLKSLKTGSILLFHDNHSRITDILETVILYAKENDYTFERLDKLINKAAYE